MNSNADVESAPGPTHDDRKRAAADLGWCALLLAIATLVAAVIVEWLETPYRPLGMGALTIAMHGSMLAGMLVLLHMRGERLADLGAVQPPGGWRRPLALLVPTQLALWVCIFPLALLAQRLHWTSPGFELAQVGAQWIPVWVAIAALVGFVEELFFRGLVLRRMTTLFGGQRSAPAAAAANVLSSLLFGLAHGFEAGPVILTGAIGLFLAIVVRRCNGNLVLAMSVHALQDSVALSFHASGD